MEIRKSTIADIPQLLRIFKTAREFMAATGNPDQWAPTYPGEALLRDDIESGDSYVMVDGGSIVATFLLRGGDDPTYAKIRDGAWLNDKPYATIHRIASDGRLKGVLHEALMFALQRYDNVRADTHRDNMVMQKALAKEGFKYCGIIRCWNGSERLAFHYVLAK